jgi:hypothetical protein
LRYINIASLNIGKFLVFVLFMSEAHLTSINFTWYLVCNLSLLFLLLYCSNIKTYRHKTFSCTICVLTYTSKSYHKSIYLLCLPFERRETYCICTTISYTLWVEWYYLKTIIWPWGQRSRSPGGHYGTQHTALWSCTHIPNIIDLSRKTKTIFPRQNTI